MANVFARISKNSKIIRLCEKPMRFTDLKKEVEISDAGLNKNLKALQKVGWIRRNMMEGGTYERTYERLTNPEQHTTARSDSP